MSWEATACLCGSSESTLFTKGNLPSDTPLSRAFWSHYADDSRPRSYGRIVRCRKCGHVYASPYLTEDALAALYAVSASDNSWNLEPPCLRRTARRYLSAALPFCRRGGFAVDAGCDSGWLLEAMREAGFEKVLGIDPSRHAADLARERAIGSGLSFLATRYHLGSLGRGEASLVAFIHVLDHLRNPADALHCAREHLETGGIVTAVTHDIGSRLARVTGSRFPALTLQHPHYFTRASLRRLFESSGFRVRAIVPTYNDFPVHHLVGFAPFIPRQARRKITDWVRRFSWGTAPRRVALGNIQIVASKG